MQGQRVVVVAETPSLARSLSDLLRSSGFVTDTVTALEAAETLGFTVDPGQPSLIIAASNGPYCATARRWIQGEFPGRELIVVGSRDPTVASAPRIHKVDLPLRPRDLLELIRRRFETIGLSPGRSMST